jgi:hypothetical protein
MLRQKSYQTPLMKVIFRMTVALVASLSLASTGVALDADNDGIDDAWEDAEGLDSKDPADAFGDLDGDRAPNLWEFSRGTAPDDALAFPAFDATVDGSKPSAPGLSRYATLQEAYDALPSSLEGLAVVDVKPGKYAAGVDGTLVPKRVAWLARSGQVVLEGTRSGMKMSHETVVDGFVFSAATGADVAGVQLKPHAALGDTIPEVRLVNCIINGRVSTGDGGAVINDGADLWLVHCTISGNAGAKVDGIANLRGSLHLMNSVVWNARSGRQQDLVNGDNENPAEVVNSVLRGTEGALGGNPRLTMDGHLTKASLICFGKGRADLGAPVDLHTVRRYETQPRSVDLGAEQWVDADKDGLPDWWEKLHFGNLEQSARGAAGGGLTLEQAYNLGTVPGNSLLAPKKDPSIRITFPPDNGVVR